MVQDGDLCSGELSPARPLPSPRQAPDLVGQNRLSLRLAWEVTCSPDVTCSKTPFVLDVHVLTCQVRGWFSLALFPAEVSPVQTQQPTRGSVPGKERVSVRWAARLARGLLCSQPHLSRDRGPRAQRPLCRGLHPSRVSGEAGMRRWVLIMHISVLDKTHQETDLLPSLLQSRERRMQPSGKPWGQSKLKEDRSVPASSAHPVHHCGAGGGAALPSCPPPAGPCGLTPLSLGRRTVELSWGFPCTRWAGTGCSSGDPCRRGEQCPGAPRWCPDRCHWVPRPALVLQPAARSATGPARSAGRCRQAYGRPFPWK